MTEDTFELTLSVSEPFSGATPSQPSDTSTPISIGGRGFWLDLASQQFSRRSVQLLNTQQAESGKDTALLTPEVWRRSTESWHEGAGQERYDRTESLPNRFRSSVGIDPWTKYQLSLLPATEQIVALTGSQKAILKSIGATLFVILPDKVRVIANAVTAPGTYVDEAFASAPVAATSDGDKLYVLTTDGVLHSYTLSTTTWAHTVATVGSFDPARAMLAYVKGFLLLGHKNVLYDYTVPGTPVTIHTHRLASWNWRDACEGLSVVYFLGGIGDRWHVMRSSIQAATGTVLDPPIVAATLPEGEFAYAISSYLGYVLIGVHQGWRFASSDGTGNLTYGQIIRTPHPVRCFEGQDRFVWFGLSAQASDALDPHTQRHEIWSDWAGLGRADLSTFVSSLTPAAASDIYADDALGQYGDTTSVVTVGGEGDGLGVRAFAVQGSAAGGVYLQTDTLVSSGVLRQGYFTFNSADQKVGLYAQVFHEALEGSIRVEVDIDALNSPRLIGTNDRVGSTSVGNMEFTESFNIIELTITLVRDGTDLTAGPFMTRAEFRALNVPGRSTE